MFAWFIFWLADILVPSDIEELFKYIHFHDLTRPSDRYRKVPRGWGPLEVSPAIQAGRFTHSSPLVFIRNSSFVASQEPRSLIHQLSIFMCHNSFSFITFRGGEWSFFVYS